MSKFYLLDKKYLEYMESIGINGELAFKKANIPIKALSKKDISISREQYINLMNALDEIIDTESLISYSDLENMIMFIPPLFAGMCSKNGIECFKIISKYKKIVGPIIIDVDVDKDKLTLEFKFDNGDKNLPRFVIFTEQILMLNILRKATGVNIIPTKVTSIYKYKDDKFEEFFGIKPYKANESIIEFSIDDVQRCFITENNVMWKYLEPELTKRIKELEIDDSFAAMVRSSLFELIPRGKGNIEMVAKELALSVRTLQRKLLSEKTTFIKQLNHTRELLAKSYLRDKSISNDDIAFLIGYSDTNSFIRAFKNWTGMTIKEYREKVK